MIILIIKNTNANVNKTAKTCFPIIMTGIPSYKGTIFSIYVNSLTPHPVSDWLLPTPPPPPPPPSSAGET